MSAPRPPTVPIRLEAAGDTHIGGRTHNEDSILVRPDLNLYVVADGAGGRNAGNVASSLAVATLAHFVEGQDPPLAESAPRDGLSLPIGGRKLSIAIQEANREILEIGKTSNKHQGMGSTVVAALFALKHGEVHIAHVGDSRAYRLRGGRLEQLTKDHNLINDVLELRPEIEDARIKKLPQNVVTRALGMADGLRVSVGTYELVHGDRFLLCSDGLSDSVGKEQIAEAMGLDTTSDDRVGLFIDLARENGARDNIAVVIVDAMLPGMRRILSRPRMAAVSLDEEMDWARKEARRPQRPSRDVVTEESTPEIVIYNESRLGDGHRELAARVVPADSVSADELAAMSELVESGPPARVAPEELRRPGNSLTPNPMAPSRGSYVRGREHEESGRYTLAARDVPRKKRPGRTRKKSAPRMPTPAVPKEEAIPLHRLASNPAMPRVDPGRVPGRAKRTVPERPAIQPEYALDDPDADDTAPYGLRQSNNPANPANANANADSDPAAETAGYRAQKDKVSFRPPQAAARRSSRPQIPAARAPLGTKVPLPIQKKPSPAEARPRPSTASRAKRAAQRTAPARKQLPSLKSSTTTAKAPPKAASPKAATPKAATPKAAPPKAATLKAATPKAAKKAAPKYTAPRLNKDNHPTERPDDDFRSGATELPPDLDQLGGIDPYRGMSTPPPPTSDSTPDVSEAWRSRSSDEAPAPRRQQRTVQQESTAPTRTRSSRLSVPPARDRLSTSDFIPTGGARMCHACGSVVSSDTNLCPHCGTDLDVVLESGETKERLLS